MEWLHVDMTGLLGKCHPIMDNITTAREVMKLRPALKMLAGDYYTGAVKPKQRSVSSECKLCQNPVEDLTHVLCHCPSFSESRQRILGELAHLLSETSDGKSGKILGRETVDNLFSEKKMLTQFILDCTSYNLPNVYRYNTGDPKVSKLFSLTRDLCFTIHTTRINLLRKLKNQTSK